MQNKYQKPAGSYISFMSNKVKTHGGINFAQGIPGFQPPKELLDELNKITKQTQATFPQIQGSLLESHSCLVYGRLLNTL